MPARVVVVDDDEALRNAVRRALRLEGYEVEVSIPWNCGESNQ